ncbi:sulfotransferase [Dyella sp. ASV21]|uniref:sulfotransferase n=1 Tax=Dyella sp. ASV21 TaxID=2795114 RepID=UPI0018EE0834
MRRTFIVGCPRSGTTIVQALLARHPEVYTLPETAFFEQLYGDLDWRWGDTRAKREPRKWHHRLGLTRKRVRELYVALRGQLPTPAARRFPTPWLRTGIDGRFIDLLDAAARAAGRNLWLEKTPNHLLYIPEIEAQLPDARFVHVVRRGTDVLASLADVYLRYENDQAFGGGTVHWARRWNRAAAIHGQHVGRPHHHFVFHDDLVQRPEVEWARLCAFLGLPLDARLDNACQQTIANLEHEPWKLAAVHGQVRPSEPKVDSVFGPQVQRWLAEHLVSYDALRRRCRDGQRPYAAPRLRVACEAPAAIAR